MVLFVVLVLMGGLLGAASVHLIVTGRNFSSWLGRGFTAADDARLRRAPKTYFRALGGVILALALMLLFAAAIALSGAIYGPHTHLSASVNEILVMVMLLILALFTVSIAWMIVVAARYRLFRWSKP